MKEITIPSNFNVDEVTQKINGIMSLWQIHLLDINGDTWAVYDWDMNPKFIFYFDVDFNDLETRIKLEDLKLNIIHHIENLKDETAYRDNLISAVFMYG